MKASRVIILNQIFSNFQQVTQWLPSDIERSSKYMNKATSLIELLEINDCGSVGGFDKENPLIRTYKYKLYDRFITLVHKNDDYNKIKVVCGFELETLGDYFKELSELRSKHL